MINNIIERIRSIFLKEKSSEVIILNELDEFILVILRIEGKAATRKIALVTGKSLRAIILRVSWLKSMGLIMEISNGVNDPTKKYVLNYGNKNLESYIATTVAFPSMKEPRLVNDMKKRLKKHKRGKERK